MADARERLLRSFLQRRLRILTTTVAILLCLLSFSFVVTLAADPAKSLGRAIVIFCTTFPNDALFFMTAASSILAFLLWVRRAGPTSLNIMDALFLQVLILPCLLLYAQMHHFLFPGFAVVVPFLMLFILAGVCGALWEAHSLGIIRRDIKPENVMLCEQGCEFDVVKVLDFGLVKDLADPGILDAEDGGISGTPETMSPESLSENAVSPTSGLYSLCVVGCFLLTGQAIFTASSVRDFLKAHLELPPIPPSQLRADVSRDLEEILLQSLEKDPSRRPESARILRQMLLGCRNAGDWDGDQAAEWWKSHSGQIGEEHRVSERAATQTLMKATSVTMTLSDHL